MLVETFKRYKILTFVNSNLNIYILVIQILKPFDTRQI